MYVVPWENVPKKSWLGFVARHRKDELCWREGGRKDHILLTDFVIVIGLMEGSLLGRIM